MTASEFDEVNVRIAEDQPQYETLPAYWNKQDGTIVFCFDLTNEEIAEIVNTGKIWFKQKTFNQPMQPIFMSTLKGDLI
jgi:hypothetical protein